MTDTCPRHRHLARRTLSQMKKAIVLFFLGCALWAGVVDKDGETFLGCGAVAAFLVLSDIDSDDWGKKAPGQL